MPTPFRLSVTQGRSAAKRRPRPIRVLAARATDAVGTSVSAAISTALYNPYSERLRDLGVGLAGSDAHYAALVEWYERPARPFAGVPVQLDEAC